MFYSAKVSRFCSINNKFKWCESKRDKSDNVERCKMRESIAQSQQKMEYICVITSTYRECLLFVFYLLKPVLSIEWNKVSDAILITADQFIRIWVAYYLYCLIWQQTITFFSPLPLRRWVFVVLFKRGIENHHCWIGVFKSSFDKLEISFNRAISLQRDVSSTSNFQWALFETALVQYFLD